MLRRIHILATILLLGSASLAGESLWLKREAQEPGQVSMFADRRAGKVGDIVTVLVQESTQQENSQSTTTSKTSSIQTAINQFLFPDSNFGTHNGDLPNSDLGGSTSYEAEGEIDQEQRVTSRFAAMVIDRLPNGTLLIEGVRLVSFGGERQYVVLRGLVRTEDVTSANTVLSTNIADARIEFHSEGSVTDVQRKGWLTRLNDWINPF